MADDERLSPFHVSLYLTLFQFWNLNRFKNPISIARQETMRLSKIGSVNNYRNANMKLPKHYCFDDLGTENKLKYFGNECNIMAEILLSRYDEFVSRKLITHLTTNLSATEIENLYGIRVRSRMRKLFNLIAFHSLATDQRK